MAAVALSFEVQVVVWLIAGAAIALIVRDPWSRSALTAGVEGAAITTLFGALFALGSGAWDAPPFDLGPTIAGAAGTLTYLAVLQLTASARRRRQTQDR